MAENCDQNKSETCSTGNGPISTPGVTTKRPEDFSFTSELSLEAVRKIHEKFVLDRNWYQYNKYPRNILLALVGEIGELCEIFQWKGEVSEGVPELTSKERVHLGQELSDVMIYLIALANACRVDLPTAVLDKLDLNAKKYPVDKAYGSSKKYTELD